jgi:hypothetical protein
MRYHLFDYDTHKENGDDSEQNHQQSKVVRALLRGR